MSFRGKIYDSLRNRTSYRVRRWLKSRSWFVPLSKLVWGNEVYSQSYYESVERIEASSVQHIGEWISVHLQPKRVIDVGCGPGHMMAALAQRGVQTFGVDLSTAALARVKDKKLPAQKFDLTADVALPGVPYELAVCCEVAEHLDARYAGRLVDHLTSAAPVVFMTAAEPMDAQTDGVGLYHVNEQPNEYWIDLMQKRGYTLDQATTKECREYLAVRDVTPYLKVPMIFRSSAV